MRTGASAPGPGRYEVFGREQWSRQSRATAPGPEAPGLFDDAARAGEAARGGPVDPDEVREIYLPLARWIEQRVDERGVSLGRDPDADAGAHLHRATTVIGITGSVAAGKTTTARVLAGLLRRGPGRPTVDLLTTDGFLFPNRVLEQRGLLGRKGFPETYDQPALVAALAGRPLGTARGGRARLLASPV